MPGEQLLYLLYVCSGRLYSFNIYFLRVKLLVSIKLYTDINFYDKKDSKKCTRRKKLEKKVKYSIVCLKPPPLKTHSLFRAFTFSGGFFKAVMWLLNLCFLRFYRFVIIVIGIWLVFLFCRHFLT